MENNEENCITPLKKSGTCISIKECEPLVKILMDLKNKTEIAKFYRDLQFLKKSICGFVGKDPKVCCEKVNICIY